MTKLRKEIEEILNSIDEAFIIPDLEDLCKKYALSVLPKEKKVKFNSDYGFNQAIKQTKEAIKEGR